jgi:hypothetical protein
MNCFLTTGRPCALSQLRPDTFEIHVTIGPIAGAERARFVALCAHQGWKALIIELGAVLPIQPMTCSRVAGGYALADAHAQEVQRHLRAHGFAVTRVKIEAAPWNSAVPQTDAAAQDNDQGGYFEFHAKLALPLHGWEALLQPICQRYQAHISHNPLRRRADASTERFVTLRSATQGAKHFTPYAEQFLAALRAAEIRIVDTVLEYCVFDSNQALDAIWFAAAPIDSAADPREAIHER